MTTTYYVRIRGRVQGPFDVNKLRSLVRRGQIGRTHEVSQDGVSWSRAVEFSELFEAPTQLTAPKPANSIIDRSEPDTAPHEVGDSSGETAQPPAAEDVWYYAVGASQNGPVNRATLQHLFQVGQLLPDTEVWAAGMDGWELASSIPGLVPANVSSKSRESTDRRSTRTEDAGIGGLVAPLRSMRVWTLLISIVGLVLCAIELVRGVIDIAANHGPRGLGILIATTVQGIAYGLLLAFSIRAGKYIENKREHDLVMAMRAMRAFWMYVGILLCILLAIVLVAISLVLAGIDMASEFADWPA